MTINAITQTVPVAQMGVLSFHIATAATTTEIQKRAIAS
jgi:hypothetical protein